jgi:sRNA-binding regulator protein Hfq
VPPSSKTKAPEQTFEESNYLRHLSEKRIPIRVRLTDNSELKGTIEFYDASFIRLTREDGPNLFLYKHDIKYLYEAGGDSEIPPKAPPRSAR